MPLVIDFSDLDVRQDDYAVRVVDRILSTAIEVGASDIHLDPRRDDIALRWRVDGTLLDLGRLSKGTSSNIFNRIKAMARMVTYRSDVPQEGRLAIIAGGVEARVGTLPTLYGERIVIRIAATEARQWLPADLGLSKHVLEQLQDHLQAPRSGVVLITGTAGSGKTTTACACMRQLATVSTITRSLVSLEDPIEYELPGVAQSQINPGSGYDWSSGLKALLRQDPEVMFVGEIRDPETAQVVFQAAMTGQLVISTMHARSAADGIRRLLDMQVPAHYLRSALCMLICQRLCRARCTTCAMDSAAKPANTSDSCISHCDRCAGTGFHGRLLLAEAFPDIEADLARAIMQDGDSKELDRIAMACNMHSLAAQASQAVAEGRIDQQEIVR